MEYSEFGDVDDSFQTSPAKSKHGPLSLAVLFAMTLSAFILLVLACVLWRHDDISGMCMIATSGTTYLHSPGVTKCWDSTTNEPVVHTFAACMKMECDLSSEPYFGQCDGIPLGIAAGVLGMAATASSYFLQDPTNKALNIGVSAMLIVATFGCAAACFVTSLYFWGEQSDQDNVRENAKVINWEKCDYTYGDARSEYKAMSAFGAITAIAACAAAVSEWYSTSQSAPALAAGDNHDVQNQFM